MKEKVLALTERLNEVRRTPFLVSLLSMVFYLLFFLVPFLETAFDGNSNKISGYECLSLFADSESLIHYASGLLIATLILSCVLVIPSLVGLFGEEKFQNKAALSIIGIEVFKLLLEIAVSILFSQTETNLSLFYGAYLIPSLTALLTFLFVLAFVNLRDHKGKLFDKKNSKE